MSTALLEAPAKRHAIETAAVEVYHPQYGSIEIPRITTLDEFRTWRHSADLPEKLNVHYFQGTILVETDMEELNSHNLIKNALTVCLVPLLEDSDLGIYVGDNMLFSNELADLGTEPDAMMILNESFASSRVTLTAGETTGAEATEMIGVPDVVVEVISPSSVKKDLVRLMSGYFSAGIPEYWIIDARSDVIRFEIYTRRTGHYEAMPATEGWTRSPILNREFKLVLKKSQYGYKIRQLLFR